MTEEFRIVPTDESHVDGLYRLVDAVARERRYLLIVAVPSVDSTRAFVQRVNAGSGVQFVALDAAGAVVGWCDIVRGELEGTTHAGHLGMGLGPAVRGRGLGEKLMRATIDAARAAGMERIELTVLASNVVARRLYERVGFAVEGVKTRARKIDGEYDDMVIMALLAPLPSR